jgi:hypothetical protein
MKYIYIVVLIQVVTILCTGCLGPSNTESHSIQTPIIYPDPPTGTLISGSQLSGGYGELTIDNTAGGSNAVAVFTQLGNKEPLSAIFIKKGDTYTFKQVADGTYELYFILGGNWNPELKKFTTRPIYQRFTDKFTFTTTGFTTTGLQYMTYKVTLYAVREGNANTDNVKENDFPKL